MEQEVDWGRTMPKPEIVKTFPSGAKKVQEWIMLEDLKTWKCGDFSCTVDVGNAWDRMTYGDRNTGHYESRGSDVMDPESGERIRRSSHIRHTTAYIEYLASVLAGAQEWPFPPLTGDPANARLDNGHHRAQAAVLAGWDKPIPVTYFDYGW
jgi:hypothetical protein